MIAKFIVIGGANADLYGQITQEKEIFADSNLGAVSIHPGGVGRNIAENLGHLGAEVDYLVNIGMSNITNHEKQLTNYCLDKLHKVENLKIHGSAKSRIGVISFNIKNIHPHDLAQFLNEYNIAVRVGHHCAQPLLSKLNETATARLSTYLYNDEQDIDKLCKALNEIISYFI